MDVFLALMVLVSYANPPSAVSDLSQACQVFGSTFAAEASSMLQQHRVTGDCCGKVCAAMKVCGAAFSSPPNDKPASRDALSQELRNGGCECGLEKLSNADASAKIMKTVLREWPHADGVKSSELSDEILFALYVSPESIDILQSNESVYRDWLGQVSDLSFAGPPERKDAVEAFRKSLCVRLTAVASSGPLVEKLRGITYRSWD